MNESVSSAYGGAPIFDDPFRPSPFLPQPYPTPTVNPLQFVPLSPLSGGGFDSAAIEAERKRADAAELLVKALEIENERQAKEIDSLNLARAVDADMLSEVQRELHEDRRDSDDVAVSWRQRAIRAEALLDMLVTGKSQRTVKRSLTVAKKRKR